MILLYLGIIAAIFTGELWIKNKIEKEGVEQIEHSILGGKIIIGKHHNKGAAFNTGEKRQPLVAFISCIVTLFCLILFIVSLGNRGNVVLRSALALLLGGAFSNTYDRLKRKYVVDYFSFGVKNKKIRNIIFNISDFCILIGALISAISY